MMTNFVKNYYKYLYSFMNINISGPLFHTSKSTVLPNMARRENYTIDYLQCLRPAEMAVSDAQTLAGNPRIPNRNGQGIEPEVFERWNRSPKMAVPKDSSFHSWWGRPTH